MELVHLHEKYGLFDARVPRFTSFPPANRFQQDVGYDNQNRWLAQVDVSKPISVYIHIPFCRRLCWFCACRTQGSRTLSPVADYVQDVITEITRTAEHLPEGVQMERLHLGGGTPTLLSVPLMDGLLETVFQHFATTSSFEFSVEVDPTEADPDLIERLGEWGMARASIGVQDFDKKVQRAIGRMQSFDLTKRVADRLRDKGVGSLNLDLLYGLPFQKAESLHATLQSVEALDPDRLALYGYAHVPHMSKRQIMIETDSLPDGPARFDLANLADNFLTSAGFEALGIDHYAKPDDSLAIAARTGRMRRNFQGYTDDTCEALIGFGASAISRFAQGYVQNAAATQAYRSRIGSGALAGHKGYVLTKDDAVVGTMIEDLMCTGRIDFATAATRSGRDPSVIRGRAVRLWQQFPDVVQIDEDALTIPPQYNALTRIIANALDVTAPVSKTHSPAI